MFVGNISDVEAVEVGSGAQDSFKRVLIGPEQGWEDYVMRLFTIKKGGHTPLHSHPWPHINYVVSGEGVVVMDGKEFPICEGSYAYVPSNIEHNYRNTSSQDLLVICIVPREGER